MSAWKAAADHVDLAVRVKPRSGRDGIEGWSVEADGSTWLVARVRALASGGKANEAALGLLAAGLDVPRSSLSLLSGQMARKKRVRIMGGPATIVSALEKLVS